MNAWLLPTVIILLTVVLGALYVAAEFATVSARRSRIQEAAEAGSAPARTLLHVMRDSHRLDNYVAGCQVGITLTSLVAGAYGQSAITPLIAPHVGGVAVAALIVLVTVTVLQVVFSELLPKTVALRYPERLALATLRPMEVSLFLFRPLIALFNGSAFRIMRGWNLSETGGHSHALSSDELETLFKASAAGGLIDANERDMVAGVFNTYERVVREIMTPRTRVVAVEAGLSVEKALKTLVNTPYTRFPVVGESIDDLRGMVSLRDLYRHALSSPSLTVESIARPAFVVADSMPVAQLWDILLNQKRPNAVVVDEYGGVAGLVSLEDALEEVFGEMQDEFDQEEEPIVQNGTRISLRGDVLLSTLNERFGLRLPEDEFDTVSGFIWSESESEPKVGDVVSFFTEDESEGAIVFTVERMDKRAVGRASFNLPLAPEGSITEEYN